MINKIIRISLLISTAYFIFSNCSRAVFVEYDTNETGNSITVNFQQNTVDEQQKVKIKNNRAVLFKNDTETVYYYVIRWIDNAKLGPFSLLKFFVCNNYNNYDVKEIIYLLRVRNKINENTIIIK